jgi:uncharacterized protein (DUF885 family)
MRATTMAWAVLAGNLCLAGCQPKTTEQVPPPPLELAADRANAFFEKAFDAQLALSPMSQSYLGVKDDYDKWDDFSDASYQRRLNLLAAQRAELTETIDPGRLPLQERLSYELFLKAVEDAHQRFPYRYHNYPVNQMGGYQSRLPAFMVNIHQVASVADAQAYVARLENWETAFNQIIEALKARAEKGIMAPRFVYPYVLEDSRNVIRGRPFDDGPEDSTLLGDFKEKLKALELEPAADIALIERAEQALLTRVKPAYENLIATVESLAERATGDDGAWKFPDGAAYYQLALEQITTTTLTANEIHQLGLTEVERIQDEMRTIMAEVDFNGSLQEFFAFMREDPQFYYDDTQEGRAAYLAAAEQLIRSMEADLDQAFLSKPKAPLVIKAVEPFREKSAGKAFYQNPAPDGSRPGVYYANLYRMADMPSYQMEALAYHEGIPGHHLQQALAQDLAGLPRFRRYGGYTAYVEGWGLYSELLPKEMGRYQNPYSNFGRLAMELWRACRLVVDTGIHHKRWTRQQAIDYLAANTPNPQGDIVKAIERYIVMPGQATAYKVGMLKILQLRQRARDALGERFDIRAFHEVVLGSGAVPLTILESQVDAYIATGAP